jgi:ADP-glucose pyrophosphorylase
MLAPMYKIEWSQYQANLKLKTANSGPQIFWNSRNHFKILDASLCHEGCIISQTHISVVANEPQSYIAQLHMNW